MGRWSDNLQIYWAHAVGTLLFAIVLWRYVSLGEWETYIVVPDKPFLC